MALEDLYKEVILDHYKNPRNKRVMPEAEFSRSRNNPLCGDEIQVFAHVDGVDVADVSFQGQGCSISQSSASMLTEAVKGKSIQDAERLAADFRGMMAGEVDPDEDEFGDFLALQDPFSVPVQDGSFDVVMLLFVFHHVEGWEDQERLLDEAVRIARRRIVVMEDTPGTRTDLLFNKGWDWILNR